MKKNLLKNMTAAIAALFIALLAMPQTALAQNSEAYVLENNGTLTFYYDANKATRTGNVYGIDQKRADDTRVPAWAGTSNDRNKRITKVVFDYSFQNYKPIDTSFWFYYCTTLKTIEHMDFLNTANVTNMRYMFKECLQLTSLDVSKFNTANVTDMTCMFMDCTGLTSLDVTKFNTEKVTKMCSMFNSCLKLTSLDVSKFNTSKVGDMSFMFSGCFALTSLDVSKFDTHNVTNMDRMFMNCEKLTSLDVASFNTTSVSNMSCMFLNCKALTTIYCNDDWNRKVVKESTDMFKNCSNLKGAVAYDANKTDVTMANSTGYFTKKNEAYVVQSSGMLTFYYDTEKIQRVLSGRYIIHDIDKKRKDATAIPAWAGTPEKTNTLKNKVVFDSSFKNYRPTTTDFWFYYCVALETIEGIENLNTEDVTDMHCMFEGCEKLTSLDISNFNTAKVTHMNYMFYGCSALTSLNVLNFNTAKVTDMRCMFYGCSALTTIYCNDDWTKGVVTQSKGMFYDCTKLKGAATYDANKTDVTMANPTTGYFTKKTVAYVVEDGSTLTFYYDANKATRTGTVYGIDDKLADDTVIPAWAGNKLNRNERTTKVVFDSSFKNYRPATTAYWFCICKKLATVEGIENLNTADVTDMSGMFLGCSALTSLDVTNFNTRKVTAMTNMFSACSALTTIYCNDNWKSDVVKESRDMFIGCKNLKGAATYDANKTDVSMANPSSGYFTRKSVAYVVEDGSTLTFYYDANKATRTGNVYDISTLNWTGNQKQPNTQIKTVVFDSSFKDYRPTTTASWFDCCTMIATIKGMENLNTEEVTNMSYMFYNCSSLTSLDVSNFNTEKVTAMSGMFSACSALTSLDLSKFNTANVTTMSSMFYGCSALTSLDLSKFNTANVTTMTSMFCGCSSLPSLNLSSFNTANVTNMTSMFHNCKSLTSLNVSNFNTANAFYMTEMFSGCSDLTSLNVSSFNTAKVKYMNFMFCDCSSLTTIYCNDDWKSDVVQNSVNMFADCTNLKGAVAYDATKTDVTMANPTTGYFTKKDPSGIDAVTVDTPAARRGIYTLNGVRLNTSPDNLPAGIYVIDGRKVVKR